MKTTEEQISFLKGRLERRYRVLKKHLIDVENCRKSIERYEIKLKALESEKKPLQNLDI